MLALLVGAWAGLTLSTRRRRWPGFRFLIRSRRQVHRRVRRGVHRHRRPHHQDARPGAAGQRDRRTLRRQRPPRTPRPHPDHQPAACRGRADRVRRALQQPSATPHAPHRELPGSTPQPTTTRRTPSDGTTGSVDCSTSISRPRHVRSVSGTHRPARARRRTPGLNLSQHARMVVASGRRPAASRRDSSRASPPPRAVFPYAVFGLDGGRTVRPGAAAAPTARCPARTGCGVPERGARC